MRVGLLIDDFFPASGGIGRSVQTQLEELVRLGHEPILVAPDRFLEKPGICQVIETPTLWARPMPPHLSVLRHSRVRAEAISGRARFDVIHSQTERGALMLGSQVARMQCVPHVHTFHANVAGTHRAVRSAAFGTLAYRVLVNPLLTRASGRRPPRTHLPHRESEAGGLLARMDWASFADIAGKVDAFTVPSPFMLDLMDEAADHPLPGFVVPTGYNAQLKAAIDTAERERDDDTIRFLALGRLSREKRIDVLVKAFLLADRPDAELVVVGDGDQRNALRRLAGEDHRIHLRGHRGDLGEIAGELVNADVLAMTSHRFESQGLVAVEAVAAGLPVLYCDDRLTVGLSRETALLSEPDVRSLAAGITQLCDRELLGRMSAATSRLLPDLSPTRTAERYLEVYTHALHGKGR